MIVATKETSTSEEVEVDEMHEVIEEKLNNARGRDYTVMMGDKKASLGGGREGNCGVKYGLGKKNDRGQN